MSSAFVNGPPGIGAAVTANFKAIFTHRSETWLAQGRYIDCAKSRDPSNTVDPAVLQAGLIMGKITASGLYAPSIIGRTGAAVAGNATSLNVGSTAIGLEMIRRFGASGTFKVTGPPAASGVVRSNTVTYSAIAAGVATITAGNANEVQTVNFNIASTGGNVVLKIPKADGTFVTTTPIAWNATDATYLASINTALDVASGVAGGIVATAIPATDTDLGFVLTFSGTGYAGLPANGLVTVETLPTSSTSAQVVRNSTGASGAFASGSFIQPADGSEVPLSFIPDYCPGIRVTDANNLSLSQVDFPQFPTGGEVDCSQLINFPTDPSQRVWLESQLSTALGGKFVFAGTGGIY